MKEPIRGINVYETTLQLGLFFVWCAGIPCLGKHIIAPVVAGQLQIYNMSNLLEALQSVPIKESPFFWIIGFAYGVAFCLTLYWGVSSLKAVFYLFRLKYSGKTVQGAVVELWREGDEDTLYFARVRFQCNGRNLLGEQMVSGAQYRWLRKYSRGDVFVRVIPEGPNVFAVFPQNILLQKVIS